MKTPTRTKKVTISVPISLHTQLKVIAKSQGKTISRLLTEPYFDYEKRIKDSLEKQKIKREEYLKNNREKLKEYRKKRYLESKKEENIEKENLKKLYKDLAVEGVHDNGEDIYLSDGVYLTKKGEMYCDD